MDLVIEFLERFPVDPLAVIRDHENHGRLCQHDLDRDPAVFHNIFKTVKDGVLDHGLDDQPRNQVIVRSLILLINDHLQRKPVVEAVPLDQHIVIDIRKFIAQRDQIALVAADAVPEESSQGFYHPGDLPVVIQESLPADGLQRIIQEMRVDLALQSRQLRLLIQNLRAAASRRIRHDSFIQGLELTLKRQR